MGQIGIMGGTFDPIHNGHLLLGKQAYLEYHLDAVWYMPSSHPPHKQHHITETKYRCEMVDIAIADYPYFQLSDFEISRTGYTYTAQTLCLLKKTYPEHNFYFIIGADSLYEIEQWYHPEEVLCLSTILVADRHYADTSLSVDGRIKELSRRYRADIRKLHCKEIEVSSIHLRSMAAAGESLDQYVPKAIADYIFQHQLYRRNNTSE